MTTINIGHHPTCVMKKRCASIMAAVVCLMLGDYVTRAQTINFDMPGGVGAVNYSGAGAAADSGIYWNPISYQTTSSGGLLSDGVTASPVTLTDASPNNFNPGQGAQGTPGGLEAPYAYENNGAPVTETLNNVPAGTYNLYLYGKNYPYSDRGTTFAVSVDATSYGSQSTVCSLTTSFALGSDYVVFSNLVVTAGETITFTYAANTDVSGNGEGDFNGLQLVNQAGGSNSGPSPGASVTGVWTGAVNGDWDIGTTANWLTNGVAGVYSQGNVVQFDDSSSAGAVNLTALLTPGSVLVNNNSMNYTFGGNGSLSGGDNFTLTKEGSAMLAIGNANTFSGTVNVGGGILQVANVAALGNGAGSTIVSNGATLDLNGYNIGNEPVFVQGSGSTGQGAINNTGGAVYPAISQVTMTGDTTLGNSGGTWEIKPQSSGGTASLSTGGNSYNLTKVGTGFVGLYGVTIDPMLHNIDVQAGSFDLENTTSGELGDATGTFTLEGGTILYFYQMLNPVSKPTVFNGGSALSNNSGPTTFTGPVALNGYVIFGLYTPLNFNGSLSGGGPLEVQAGSGALTIGGTNTYAGDIYMDNGVGALVLNGQGAAATGTVYLGNNDSLTVDGSFGGSATDSGSTGTSLFGNGVISGSADFSGLVNPGYVNSAGTLTVGSLTLESGATLNMDLSSSVGGSNDLLQVNGNLALNGNNVVLNFLDGHLQAGTYRLINYTGTLSGSFGALQTRARATIDTSTPGQVNLIVTDGGTPANLLWNTNNTGVWDVDASSNWFNLGTASQDLFYSGDSVSFDDLPGVPASVSISGLVSPSSITVDSSTNNFTFGGSGTISGAGSLTKSGNSTLTLNTAGNFTGPVTINGGTLAEPGNTLASVSSITITNGGTLDFDGAAMTGGKPIIVSDNGVNGEGAIYNSGNAPSGEVLNITLTGDTTFGNAGSNSRWDLVDGSFLFGSSAAHSYKIIINNANGGYNEWDTVTIATNIGDIELAQGSWGLKGLGAGIGDPTKTITVDSGCALTVWGSSVGPNSGYGKNIYVKANSQFGVRPGVPDTYFDANVVLESNVDWYYFNGSGSGQTINGTYVLNGIVHLQIGDSAVTFTNVISGPGGFIWDTYNNETVFEASNTYSGPTVICGGLTLGLSGNGSISHSSLIFFGGNSSDNHSLDVSGRPDQTLTLADGQTLAGIGGIDGSLIVSAGATLSPAGTNITLGITAGANSTGTIAASGSVTLNGTTVIKLNGSGANDAIEAGSDIIYGGTLNLVNISGSALAAGDSFQIFDAASYSGSFGNITPTTPGEGLMWDLSQLGNGKISIIGSGGSRPVIGGTLIVGGDLVMSGGGGTANGTYYVLTSTNLAAPIANWIPVATNTFDASGNFSFTNEINTDSRQQFYLLEQP